MRHLGLSCMRPYLSGIQAKGRRKLKNKPVPMRMHLGPHLPCSSIFCNIWRSLNTHLCTHFVPLQCSCNVLRSFQQCSRILKLNCSQLQVNNALQGPCCHHLPGLCTAADSILAKALRCCHQKEPTSPYNTIAGPEHKASGSRPPVGVFDAETCLKEAY